MALLYNNARFFSSLFIEKPHKPVVSSIYIQHKLFVLARVAIRQAGKFRRALCLLFAPMACYGMIDLL